MRLFGTIAAITLISGALSSPLEHKLTKDWQLFKETFGKAYESIEHELSRKAIWAENARKIDEHNEQYLNGVHTYTVGMNHLGDMTHHEVKSMYNGYNSNQRIAGDQFEMPASDFVAPEEVDWRTKGAVTDIKNQGRCGSCWAFSAVGALEGQHYLKKKELVSLSEQNLVDCSTSEGNEGCRGGLMDQGFEYIMKAGGIDTELYYPYTGKDGRCKFNKYNVGATVAGFTDIPKANETALTAAIATVGPISVAIDASGFGFQFYRHGIYHSTFCSSTELDHGVLAVGYGSENGDYYIVKNSWGKSWGMKGYLWMSRNRNNNCGIATQASFPKV